MGVFQENFRKKSISEGRVGVRKWDFRKKIQKMHYLVSLSPKPKQSKKLIFEKICLKNYAQRVGWGSGS